MIEVEMKFRIQESDRAKINENLLRLGASFKYEQNQTDSVFLESKHKSFETFSQGDPVARLRKSQSGVVFTVKRKLDDSSSLEIETECSDFEKMSSALTTLGLNKIVEVNKDRQVFQLNEDVTLSIDTVKGLGLFVEIELLKENDEDLAEAKEAIIRLARELGIKESGVVTKKYDAMLTEKIAEQQNTHPSL